MYTYTYKKNYLNSKFSISFSYLSKRQTHKTVKHTQTTRRLLPTNCLSVFDHFVELALIGLNKFI